MTIYEKHYFNKYVSYKFELLIMTAFYGLALNVKKQVVHANVTSSKFFFLFPIKRNY